MKISARVINKAIKCIKNRNAYNIKTQKYCFVNKLIYWADDLMLIGYAEDSKFKVEDYGKTWVVCEKEVL